MLKQTGKPSYNTQSQQQGSVLLISLMLLIVLTLMTFTLSNSVILQQKMTVADRDDALALQVAEFALRDAERQAQTYANNNAFTKTGNKGLYDGHDCDSTDAQCYVNTLANVDFFDDSNWTDANSRQATTKIDCSYGAACPETDSFALGRYKIIFLNNDVDVTYSGSESVGVVTNQNQDANDMVSQHNWLYKVIAIGQGMNPSSRRVLVSYLVTPAP